MFSKSNSALPCFELSTKAGASALVSMHGGHLLSWKPSQCKKEQLYLSKVAAMDGKSAIRGGVPVLFPHFGAQSNSPNHGFARLHRWSYLSDAKTEISHALTLELLANDETRRFWPHDFQLHLSIVLSDESIHLNYEVTNTGEEAFNFNGGLHTYFATSDISKTQLLGLKECSYIEAGEFFEEGNELVEISGEVDRAYLSGEQNKHLVLMSPDSRVEIESSGFSETVVWNPWSEGAVSIVDMPDDDYLKMICVESVVIAKKIKLVSGQSWSGTQTLNNKFIAVDH